MKTEAIAAYADKSLNFFFFLSIRSEINCRKEGSGCQLLFFLFLIFLLLRTWVIHLPMSSDDIAKVIRGNKVAFQDCFIANLYFMLTYPMTIISEPPGYEPLTVPPGSPLMLSWDTCISTFALLATDQETFQTNDSFQTWTRVRAPPGILSDAQRHSLRDVIIFDQGTLFLVDGTVYLRTEDEFTKLDESRGISETGILGLSKRRWCQIRYLYKVSER